MARLTPCAQDWIRWSDPGRGSPGNSRRYEVFPYPDCNLVEFSSPPFVGTAFTYDATTHELVGAHTFSDVLSYDCAGEDGRTKPAP